MVSHEINLLHSNKRDRAAVIPLQVPLPQQVMPTKVRLCQILRAQELPLGTFQVSHKALDTFTLPGEAPSPYIMQVAEPNTTETRSAVAGCSSFGKPAPHVPRDRDPSSP